MRRPDFDRDRHPHWPHFDNRGPEYYYDDDPWDGRGAGWGGIYHGSRDRRPPYDDSDIYENEFERRPYHDMYDGRYREHWPEDDFHENRHGLRDFRDEPRPERGRRWMRLPWRHSGPPASHHYNGPRGFPEDRHDHSYGRNIHDRNLNRGRFTGDEDFRYR